MPANVYARARTVARVIPVAPLTSSKVTVTPAAVDLGPVTEAPALVGPDYRAMNKDALIEAAEALGVDSSGTKAAILARIERGS